MEKVKKNKLIAEGILFVLSFLLGFIGISFYTNTINSSDLNVASEKRLTNLIEQLENSEEEKTQLSSKMLELSRELSDLEESYNKNKEENDELNEKFEEYKILSGEYKVVGPGLIIKISFPQESGVDIGVGNLSYYILNIVSNLNSAGAEAISINDQRYTSHTEIVPVGQNLNINGKSVTAPIEIKAIGDGRTLNSAVNFIGGSLMQIRTMGFIVESNEEKKVEILPVSKLKEFKYAIPIEVIE